MPCVCPGAKRNSSGTAWHCQTWRTEWLSSVSHPKPKCHGAVQPGLSTGLFHFKSQQFVLSRVRHSHQKLPQFMNRPTTAPSVLFKVFVAQSAIPSFSIHQARTTLLRCGYRFGNRCLNRAHRAVGSRVLQTGQGQSPQLTSPGASAPGRGAEGHQPSLPGRPFGLHPTPFL